MEGRESMEVLLKRVRELEERAEEAEQQRQLERQRAEEAEQQRQLERQRAEEAEQQRQLERQRAEEADQRAEEAEQQRQLERQRAEEAEQLNRPTTLSEYLEASHELVFSKLRIETDRSLTSKGSVTNPQNKYCPTRLVRWPGFLERQREVFGSIHSLYPAETRAFESLGFLRGLGGRISRKRIANEKDLEYFQHISVEDPVRSIVDHLVSVADVRDAFDLGAGIVFENHPNAISDVAEEVVDRRAAPPRPSTPEPSPIDRVRFRPDQICVYRRDDGSSTRRTTVYINEYKAPHKITTKNLRVGLHPMDIYKDVVNRPTIPAKDDAAALFQYHSERLVAAVITQTFHYMVEGGLEYGVITTGEAMVFLKMDWSDPTTLAYHITEPAAEVLAHPRDGPYCTAVGQMLAFSLMALDPFEGRRPHGQNERRSAMARLHTWSVDYETILGSIPAEERTAPPSSPAWVPETYSSVDRSPRVPARKRRRVSRDPTAAGPRARSPDPSDEEDMRPSPTTPTPAEPRTQGARATKRKLAHRSSRDAGAGGFSHGDRERHAPYCTQQCLLRLTDQALLDDRCPNVARHRSHGDGVRHPIRHGDFVTLLRDQLERTLDEGIEKLDKGGARGVLFRVTLLTYGYTFVGKGTVPEFIEDLKHEAAVYARLRPVQGKCVPVFLGAVDLRAISRTYYYDFRVRIQYMLFLSWGGESLTSDRGMDGVDDLSQRLLHSVRSLHACGVVHRDLRSPNVLFHKESGQVMIIDFERARLMDTPRRPLTLLAPNKRKRSVGDSGAAGKSVSQGSSVGQSQQLIRDDKRAAMAMFTGW